MVTVRVCDYPRISECRGCAQRAVTPGGRGPPDLRPRVVAGAEPGGGGRDSEDTFGVVGDPEVPDVIERNP